MKEILNKYFPNLTDEQIGQYEMLQPLYEQWNAAINVISRKDIEELNVRHVLHSLAIAKACNFNDGARILDVGCGGGFPVIPLAIMFPKVQFTAVDSIGKKIRVVEAVAKALNLCNVNAINARAESLNNMRFDYVVSRAVADTSKLKTWCWKMIEHGEAGTMPNGMILLKGGDLSEELSELRIPYTEYPIAEWFNEEFFATKKVIIIPKR